MTYYYKTPSNSDLRISQQLFNEYWVSPPIMSFTEEPQIFASMQKSTKKCYSAIWTPQIKISKWNPLFLFYDVQQGEVCQAIMKQALNFLLCFSALPMWHRPCAHQVRGSQMLWTDNLELVLPLSYGTSFCSRSSKIDFIAKFLLVLLSRNNLLNHALVRDIVDNACHPFLKIILFIFWLCWVFVAMWAFL